MARASVHHGKGGRSQPVQHVTTRTLSTAYEVLYSELLTRCAIASPDTELAPFWPKIGARYDGDLLLVGRATNGWIDRWVPSDGIEPAEIARVARQSGEGLVNGDQLGWVLDRWQPGDGGYSTATSQFWQTTSHLMAALRPDEINWPSLIAWTNLTKVAPWTGGNPDKELLGVQRGLGPQLLAREVAELEPRLVVAFTGQWWFEPFADELGLPFEWRTGLVVGVARETSRTWVVAVHPMTRSPRAVADAVLAAIRDR